MKNKNEILVNNNKPQPLTPLQVDIVLSSASSLVYGAELMFSNWGNKMRNDLENINKLPIICDKR